jgi:hypothetical protein
MKQKSTSLLGKCFLKNLTIYFCYEIKSSLMQTRPTIAVSFMGMMMVFACEVFHNERECITGKEM